MKRLLILFIELAFIVGLGVVVYFTSLDSQGRDKPPKLILTTDHLHLLNSELEDKLVFYLAQQLGTYEGTFEIIDIVSLDTHDIAGADYILVTFRAPDGKLCQVTLLRKPYPWAEWEIMPASFNVTELPQAQFFAYTERPQWIKELGITAEQVRQYYIAHSGMTEEEVRGAFLDEKTRRYALPVDWWQVVPTESPFKLEIDKGKPVRFVSSMDAGSALNYYWRIDYPAEYMGPGYRAYLYEKIKQKRW